MRGEQNAVIEVVLVDEERIAYSDGAGCSTFLISRRKRATVWLSFYVYVSVPNGTCIEPY